MAQEIKERSSDTRVAGNYVNPTGSTGSYDFRIMETRQRTSSDQNPVFLLVEAEKRRKRFPPYWRDFMSRQDLGSAFRTEKGTISSNTHSVFVQGNYSGAYNWVHSGPLYLNGFKDPLGFRSQQELNDEAAILFALGGSAISRVRPGKPQVDLATALGEIRMGGIPTLIGSLYARAKTFKDIFRESGNEYLNVQFGWAPLIRDLQDLSKVVLSSRDLLQSHEKQLNKLLHRTYSFDTLIDTSEGLSKTLSNYELPVAPWGKPGRVTTGAQLGYQVPIEITRKVTKSHFSGGFRFYYPEIDTALDHLAEIESQANLLLGTRIDPEVLWNLQPWTWLVDWFINFGDVLGNLSAILADGLVVQYGYIMQEVDLTREITLPRGLRLSNFPQPTVFTEKPLEVTLRYHSKVRAKASPFGFGLTPEMFSPQQWAILAALGISRGLK